MPPTFSPASAAMRSARTRVTVVTEGIFVARIQAESELAGVSSVLFDEVHERSLDSDFGLALALVAQGALRPDLRIVAMSATLDGARFANLLGDEPVIEREGRSYPLDLRYLGRRGEARVEDEMAAAILLALSGFFPLPVAALAEARARTATLDSFDADGRPTAHGRAIARLPMPPRLAHMLVRAGEMGLAKEAAEVAVLLGERGLGGIGVDLETRVRRFRSERGARAESARRLAERWALIPLPLAGGVRGGPVSARSNATCATPTPTTTAEGGRGG